MTTTALEAATPLPTKPSGRQPARTRFPARPIPATWPTYEQPREAVLARLTSAPFVLDKANSQQTSQEDLPLTRQRETHEHAARTRRHQHEVHRRTAASRGRLLHGQNDRPLRCPVFPSLRRGVESHKPRHRATPTWRRRTLTRVQKRHPGQPNDWTHQSHLLPRRERRTGPSGRRSRATRLAGGLRDPAPIPTGPGGRSRQ